MDLTARIDAALAYAARLEREAQQLRDRSAAIRQRAMLLRMRAHDARRRSMDAMVTRQLGRVPLGGNPADFFVNGSV
jgi:hypothetical protein